ncbi:homoserine dehydrogenase [Sphingosinicella rhizophila]|nr:homoserine dehydrogenase [Sphingosinicella sp. GR2756]
MTQQDSATAQPARLCVLKFGSSVLRVESDYPATALEIYRHIRDGEKVVAVVSALGGETDALLNQGMRVGGDAPALLARLARVGELHSAALMALALTRIGVRACTMDPHEMGLMAEGAPLDSNLTGLDADAILAKLDHHEVVVVPGFTAGHDEYGVVTLGRGGTDLTAVFFAARLGAHRVRLIKDVDGVYTADPARNPLAERYAELSYGEAAKASAGLIQDKAIVAAEAQDVLIEVAAMGSAEATTVANVPARSALPLKGPKLRVALLGCGAVGAGVLDYLKGRPDLFEINPVLVRRPHLHEEHADFTDDLHRALGEAPDLVVELIGGADEAAEIMRSALRSGTHVVSANKAAIAKHYDALHACAEASGASLRYSAAVGGGTPVLEMLARLGGSAGIQAIEGVMNGTGNFLISRLSEGWSFDEAVAKAQELGFAEADPAADVDGHDVADKLSLLVREAFGVALPTDRIARQSLREVTTEQAQAALARGEVLKQVGRCWLDADGRVHAGVQIEGLSVDHPLAGARNEENRFLVRDAAGLERCLHGKGAGRWPTASAVFADIMDLQRGLLLKSAPAFEMGEAIPLLRTA